MSQSLSKILIHIIFSTKNRFTFLIDNELRKRMHAYLVRVFNEHDSPAIGDGGTDNHIHILCLLSKNHSISEIIRKTRANSSGWAKSLAGRCRKFSWQSGYGVFSIHQSQIEPIREYIQCQMEHHHRKTFQEEYLEILQEYRIPYDERFLWK